MALPPLVQARVLVGGLRMVAVPCLSACDACSVYPVLRATKRERWCCRAREMHDQGALSDERLEEACSTLKARREGFVEVPSA